MASPATAEISHQASSSIWLPFMPTSCSVDRLVSVIEPAMNGQVRPPPARKNSRLELVLRPPVSPAARAMRRVCHQVAAAMAMVSAAKTASCVVFKRVRPRLVCSVARGKGWR